ncbi:MAG TPA: GatB/YqeY domain-containing protein [Ignavibacteria bacterium]|nr:GatB/YqeY domain-containing protein [Ignavibacteria bacterium]
MSLKTKINDDLNTALKSKDSVKIDTLRSIRAEILKMDKSGMNREMNEEEEIQLLSKQAKMRRESIDLFSQAGRNDLVEKEQAQLNVINEYLPKQMSREDADVIISKIVSDSGVTSQKDFGKVMGEVMKELKGKIDGKIIQEILKSKLNQEA